MPDFHFYKAFLCCALETNKLFFFLQQGCEPEAERDLDENLRKLEQSPNWRKSRLTQTSTPVFSHSSSFRMSQLIYLSILDKVADLYP